MANTRSSAKRARQELKRKQNNLILKSKVRTSVRKARQAIESKDEQKVLDSFRNATKSLAKAAQRGIIKPGKASRLKSRLALLAKKNTPKVLTAPAAKASRPSSSQA